MLRSIVVTLELYFDRRLCVLSLREASGREYLADLRAKSQVLSLTTGTLEKDTME